MKRSIRMHQNDMVATVLESVDAGEYVDVFDDGNKPLFSVCAVNNIPYGNKIALSDIEMGEKVVKYGAVIGVCTNRIKRGELVHVHNVKSQYVDIPASIREAIIKEMGISVNGRCPS
ncbi:UxaA family hydrolase [Synergistes jonesii]|uniref:SAF domain-containing protein n=2 Tax=Synergistes jonesii TaxID=2754 RepID=A0A073J775_9BACT|nr:UxaA family hydrolase [Synergistes jonesii]KEJ93557.1 hypothetical protein EH55_01930 [Synergistes jonesii]MDY2984306.1 UxaA family hydrolase [Synergistes jonesii]